ncbi:ABC multidrug transporter C [Physcia stellaris]|nr:ABC multidrug transporter C [Physcia stellaris]
MARDKISKQPSNYPPLVFHLLRTCQLLSTLIVASVLIFFCHHLHVENIYIPWTFIVLLTVSLLTIVAFLVTSVFYTLRTLSPKLNLYSNTALTALWCLGLALLTWNLSWTLGHRCTTDSWKNDAGIMVCRLFKALTAFAVTGTLTTALLTLLDLRTHRANTASGAYNAMHDIKPQIPIPRSSSPFPNDPWDHPYSADSYGVRSPPGYTEYQNSRSQELARPYKVQKQFEAEQFGYQAPSEQTMYDGAGGRPF